MKVGRLEVMQENSTKAITDMASSVNKLVDKLDKSDDVAKDALYRAKVSENRIKDLEDDKKWMWRTSIGALITGSIGLLFAAIKLFA